VNFVGHAVVAAREVDDPAFAFGAMVPDHARFARRAPLDAGDVVAAGIASHHRADAAFHDSVRFRTWMAAVAGAMPTVDRGARAAAHVAVELAIDGALLRAGAGGAYDAALAWGSGELDGAWLEVVDRMRTGEIVAAYASAEGIAGRVVAVLGRRPRLARLAVDAGDLARALESVEADICDALDRLLDEVSERSLM
jgi:hypothetical protein